VDVYIFDEQKALSIPGTQVEAIAAQVIDLEGKRYDEVSVNFVDSSSIQKLHKDFFDDDTPTDCISFPMDDDDESGYKVLGEIFVCPEVAIEYANEHGLDPYEETTLYVVHGLLHLMGYDDIEEVDVQAMRGAEKRHMSALKKLGLTLQNPKDLAK
jgi:probable rRNA maturation factor